MNRLFIFAIALLTACASHAGIPPLTQEQIAGVVGHCRCVMNSDVCIVETQRPLTTQPVTLTFYGEVSAADWNYLTLAGDSMCDEAERELRRNSVSARSAVARKRWRSSWSPPCAYPARITGRNAPVLVGR